MTDASEADRQSIPADFELSTAHSRFGRHVGPYYIAERVEDGTDSKHWTGLKIDERHGGRGEHGHGGILMALLDEAMGRAASRASGAVCVTVSMQTSFCAVFRIGDFLRASATVTRRGRNLIFVDGLVMAGDSLVATAAGVWKNSGQPLPD